VKAAAVEVTFVLPLALRGAGGRTVLGFAAGRKYLHAVAMGEPISIVKIPIANGPALRPVFLKSKPYPIRRAARRYLKSEISKTDRAAKVLRALARGQTEFRP